MAPYASSRRFAPGAGNVRHFLLEPVRFGDVTTLPEHLVPRSRWILPAWVWIALAFGAASATLGATYYAARPR